MPASLRVSLALLLLGCARSHVDDVGPLDAGPLDAGPLDAGPPDAGPPDAAPDAGPPDADLDCAPRTMHISFTPAARVTLAVFAEDESHFATIGLTEAVAYRGIGNRPGASQMNSGYRWPIGRREGALPFWAHRRVERGGLPFARVVFQDRAEGFVSGGPSTSSLDAYGCLSFERSASSLDGLDAVTCPSPTSNDKGRFLTPADVAAGYAEPVQTAGLGSMFPLSLTSLYPPRQDLTPAPNDHPDVAGFASEARRAMPELDAVTMATPAEGARTELTFVVPADWTTDVVTVYVEAHTEGDHGGPFHPGPYPTPIEPAGAWDGWSQTYGYPYRGQPSVVYRVDVPMTVGAAGTSRTTTPIGRTVVDGRSGALEPMDGIFDEPSWRPGSGADRLLDMDGRVVVTTSCP